MKKISKFMFLSAMLFTALLSSCGTTKVQDSVVQNDGTISSGEEYTEKKEGPSNQKEKEKSFLEKLWGSHKFIDLDMTTIYTNTVTGKLKKQDCTIVYFDKEKMAGFGSQYVMAYYYVSFSDNSRKKLANAYELYLSDFQNKKLDRENKKSQKVYGDIDIRLDWGTVKSSTPNWGTGKAQLGYKFKEGSPYFTITIYPISNEKFKEDQDAYTPQSMLLTYSMTKAQGAEIKNFLSDEYLRPYMNIAEERKEESVKVEKDDY